MESLVILGIVGPTEIIAMLFTLAIIIFVIISFGSLIRRLNERTRRNDKLIDLQKQILEELKKLNANKN